jgi:hypothetical protein
MEIAKLIAFLISLTLLYFAYDYLRKLETCICAQQMGVVPQADIETLKHIEILMIVLLILNYFIAFQRNIPILFATLLAILMIAIYVFFVIHVRRLYMNMPDTCDCSMKFPRYILYVQAVFMSIALLMWALVFFMTIMTGVALSLVSSPGTGRRRSRSRGRK